MEQFLDYLIRRFIDNPVLSAITLGVLVYLYHKIISYLSFVKKAPIYRNLKCILKKQLRIFLSDDWVKIDKQIKWGLIATPIILGNMSRLPFVNATFILISLYCWFFIILSGSSIKPHLNNWEVIKSMFIECKWFIPMFIGSVFCFTFSSNSYSFLPCLLIAIFIVGITTCLFAMLPRIVIQILRPFIKLLYQNKNFRKAVLTSVTSLIFLF